MAVGPPKPPEGQKLKLCEESFFSSVQTETKGLITQKVSKINGFRRKDSVDSLLSIDFMKRLTLSIKVCNFPVFLLRLMEEL